MLFTNSQNYLQYNAEVFIATMTNNKTPDKATTDSAKMWASDFW